MTAVGLSSGSAPAMFASDLGRQVLDLGGTVVDLRAGKGHAWERDGLSAVRATGVEVCFVGVSTTLGDAAYPPESIARLPWLHTGVPVKVFAADGCCSPQRWELTRAQVQALSDWTGDPSLVLAETHHGYAAVPELVELCERAGVRLLLDTLGLARVDAEPLLAARRIGPWTTHAQVKGFDTQAPDSAGHRPLAESNAEWTCEVLAAAGPLRAVTLESRAAALTEDTALVRTWFPPAQSGTKGETSS